MKLQDSEIINVRLPSEVTGNLDKLLKLNLFSSRAELIRVLLRDYVEDSKQKEDSE